jgi:hypothetical protein
MIVGYNPLKWRPFSLNAGIFRLIFCSIFRIKPDWKRNAAIRTRGKPPTNPIGLLFLLTFVESNWLGGTLSGQKRPISRHTSYIFFYLIAATAYKNPLRLAKNGLFFVSDATTLTSCCRK